VTRRLGRGLLPTSLTGRLVATLVAVVVLTALLLGVLTSLATQRLLYAQLDHDVPNAMQFARGQVRDHAARGSGQDGGLPPGPDRHDGPRTETLIASIVDGVASGSVLNEKGHPERLSRAALQRLRDVPVGGVTRTVDLPGYGSFRLESEHFVDGVVLAGVSTRKVDEAVGWLLILEIPLGIAAVTLAGLGGLWLVRRQLRPLRRVAATAHKVSTLPLASGEIGRTVRVPDSLTDERTEVGAVGAALNTLLAHVEQALDERHRSEQQVRQFVADASHELRTPLSTIHGYAELSRRRRPPDPEQLAQAMSKVEAEATRMSALVQDLLLLARLDAGRPLARDEVDLTKLVLETVGDARVVAPGHRWLLDLPDEPLQVMGDEQRLHQVVTNLLNNARRHTPPGTSVRVAVAPARRAGDDVVLTVTDDGPGMPPELVRTAFERFSRGDSSRTRESGGAGLGLSMVQAITTAHGGTVSVASRPGRTRLEVRLPSTRRGGGHRSGGGRGQRLGVGPHLTEER
jgi:two-component system, OmpR family, sensor kinase